MSEVFLVEALRTPFGAFGGALADVEATQLAASVIEGLLTRSGLAASTVDEVIIGQVLSGGCGQAPARQAMRAAGIPDSAAAMTINKVCGSGLKALMLGADSIRLGNSGVVLAGGMENMSQSPYLLKKARTGYRMGHGQLLDSMLSDGLLDPYTGRHMGEIGEVSITRNELTREELDAFALRSYQLAQAAVTNGTFSQEIVPVTKKGKTGNVIIDTDEEPFKGDPVKLTSLRTAFTKDGSITAGNASTINDGAALAILTDKASLEKYGLKPKARILAYATESLHPDWFPEAPVGAIEKACQKAGISVSDIDLFEINEAFASVTLYAIKKMGLPLDKVNVNGGACAIGHPVGASGARLTATLVRELHKRQVRYGVASICIGGGEAVAVLFERI